MNYKGCGNKSVTETRTGYSLGVYRFASAPFSIMYNFRRI